MGIMLLVLMPVPYVDASSSLAFPEKRKRILVGAAGMMVELFLASLALFLWLNVEQGIVRSLAYNVIFIASVSTVLFNGNPLLRYDGYYILSDILEIPNLAQRSIDYLGYLFKRYLFGLKETQPPYAGPGKRFWLFIYSITAFIYRGFVFAAIILFIAGKFFFIGILLGIWAFINMFIVPVFKRIQFVVSNSDLRGKRARAVLTAGVIILAVLLLLFFMPFPSWTRTEGVIWVPEESHVRAGTSCFVEDVAARPNVYVKKGDVLIKCQDPILVAHYKTLKAELNSLNAQYNAQIYTDRVQALITKEEISHVRANLARSEERLQELTVYSPSNGQFVIPDAEDLPGRYLNQGELVAYVLEVDTPTVRVVVKQSDVDLVRQHNRNVEVRLAERLDQIFPAVIKREVPGAVERLPSTALGSAGGGEIPIEPRDAEGVKTLEKMFQFDIELPSTVDDTYIGGRVFVRFDHGFEPLAFQWYRSLRLLFMRRFNV